MRDSPVLLCSRELLWLRIANHETCLEFILDGFWVLMLLRRLKLHDGLSRLRCFSRIISPRRCLCLLQNKTLMLLSPCRLPLRRHEIISLVMVPLHLLLLYNSYIVWAFTQNLPIISSSIGIVVLIAVCSSSVRSSDLVAIAALAQCFSHIEKLIDIGDLLLSALSVGWRAIWVAGMVGNLWGLVMVGASVEGLV